MQWMIWWDSGLAYIGSGKPFQTSDGRVFQNGSRLWLNCGFWWWDVGCAIAPEGAEKNLPVIHTELDDREIADHYQKCFREREAAK